MPSLGDEVRAAPYKNEAGGSDPYDERQREAKALAQWERQKVAWAHMQTHLEQRVSPTPHSRRHRSGRMGAVHNFSGATSAARARREDLGLLSIVRPDPVTGGSYAWEGLLRLREGEPARRLVPIGRTSFPYQLYTEIGDPTTLPADHMNFTRVISEDDAALEAATAAAVRPRKNHASLDSTRLQIYQRSVAQRRVRAALTASGDNDTFQSIEGSDGAGATKDEEEDADGEPSYYESQLRRVAPLVQERLGHFLQPRDFLLVDGQPAPHATAADREELKRLSAARPCSAPPVEYYPPPPPQTQLWASVPAPGVPNRASTELGLQKATKLAAAVNASRLVAASDRLTSGNTLQLDDEEEEDGEAVINARRVSVATATPSDLPADAAADAIEEEREKRRSRKTHGAATELRSPLHPMQVETDEAEEGLAHLGSEGGVDVAEDESDKNVADGPAMVLSTRSLFFHTRPGELLQGTVTVQNTGTTTIYYSWVPVDAVEEQHRYLEALSQTNMKSPTDAEDVSQTVTDMQMQEHLPFLGVTHALAAHQKTARDSFFHLSSPANGVVLPSAEGVFTFSVRASRVGLFQHTYELLTVPPAPQRLFLRLRAIVQRDGPSWEWLSAPVAQALEAKVALQDARRLVQDISMNEGAIERDSLAAQIASLDGALSEAKAAERARRKTQEGAWQLANRLTFDHLAYVPAVYDKLEQLHAMVRRTCQTLGRKAEGGEGRTGGGAANVDALRGEPHATPANTSIAAPTVVTTADGRGKTKVLSEASPAPAVCREDHMLCADKPLEFPERPVQWDGSLLLLLHDIMAVRDSPTRQTFLDAFLLLLRAARASQSSGGDGDCSDSYEAAEAPLPVLLAGAASALAEGVRARRAVTLRKDCEDTMALRLFAPATPFMQAFTTSCEAVAVVAAAAATSSTSQVGAAAAANRSHSPANKKRVPSPRGKGAPSGAAASERTDAVSSTVSADPSRETAAAAAEVSVLQKVVLDAIPVEELLGFSAIGAPAKVVEALESAEEEVLCRLKEGELKADRTIGKDVYVSRFKDIMDEACDRGPLLGCTADRLEEMRTIQTSIHIPVDPSVEQVVPVPTGKGNKRK